MACAECAPRYCAPNRCYCGHDVCDARATFVAHTQVSTTGPVYDDTAASAAPVMVDSTWDDRDESTWIDNL